MTSLLATAAASVTPLLPTFALVVTVSFAIVVLEGIALRVWDDFHIRDHH